MKLLTILILLPCFCFGQKKDSLAENVTDSARWIGLGTLSDSVIAASGTNTFYGGQIPKIHGIIEFEPKFDTIPVIMLVCDTTKEIDSDLVSLSPVYNSESISKKTGRRGYFVNGYLNDTWWMFGYEVRQSVFVPAHETNNGDGTITLFPDEYQDRLVGRLDQNKKGLSTGIVVWLTKKIK